MFRETLKGIPDALYEHSDLQSYLKKQLETEYQGLVPPAELAKEIETVLALLPLRGTLPNRLKKLLLQETVGEFVTQERVSAGALQDALREIQKPQATLAKAWGLKYTAWKTFFKKTLTHLLPQTLPADEQESYAKIELEAVRGYLNTQDMMTSGGGRAAGPEGGVVPHRRLLGMPTKQSKK